MSYNRGDIIEIIFELPYNESSKPHPVIIISNADVYEQDGLYICVMITHMTSKDQYTFEITDQMLLKQGDGKFSQARCHLITNVSDEDIIPNRNRNSMKLHFVDRLVTQIETVVLS
jgi:mRNA-degrading endonuclease toxin of MazEF toxin-antitoxin module